MFSVNRCINRLSSTIVLNDTTEQAINGYVKENCKECYEIHPGFEFRGVIILLKNPMLVGFKIKKKKILMPFVKPCFGPILIELTAEDGEFELIRNELAKAA